MPFLIGIGSSKSNAGKTTIAVEVLKHLDKNHQNWGAVKYTKTALYSSMIDDPSIIKQKGKDTERLLSAGAKEVLWVQSPAEELADLLPMAVDRMSNLDGIIIEGNSAIEFLKPDIVIFIFKKDSEGFKKSGPGILEMSDIILFDEKPSVKLPEKAKNFNINLASMSGAEEFIEYLDGLINERQNRRRD